MSIKVYPFMVLVIDEKSSNALIVDETPSEQTARLVCTDQRLTEHVPRHRAMVAVKVLHCFNGETYPVTQPHNHAIPYTSENARSELASCNTAALQGTRIHMAGGTDTGDASATSHVPVPLVCSKCKGDLDNGC